VSCGRGGPTALRVGIIVALLSSVGFRELGPAICLAGVAIWTTISGRGLHRTSPDGYSTSGSLATSVVKSARSSGSPRNVPFVGGDSGCADRIRCGAAAFCDGVAIYRREPLARSPSAPQRCRIERPLAAVSFRLQHSRLRPWGSHRGDICDNRYDRCSANCRCWT
jgi:hypothetical protein